MSRPPLPPTDRLSVVPLPEDVSRERSSEQRIADAPKALQEWFDATSEDPHADARLRAWADALVPDPDAGQPAEDEGTVVDLHPGRWRAGTLAVLGVAVAAAALALVVPRLTGETSPDGAQAPVAATTASVEQPVEPATVVAPAPAAPDAPTLAQTPATVSPAPAPSPATVTAPSPTPALAAAPAVSPSLTERDVIASGSTWQGELVPGLHLQVDQGQARVEGTRAEPRLVLAADSSILVDVDRSAVSDSFERFTVQTLSGEVEVLGTRYEVTSVGGVTTVRTERGLVEVRCTDGRIARVAAGQTASCDPQADPSVLAHLRAMERASGKELTIADHRALLDGLLDKRDPRRFLVTSEVVLSGQISDPTLRNSLELARVEAMCRLGWEEPARGAARAWLTSDVAEGRDFARGIAQGGCTDG